MKTIGFAGWSGSGKTTLIEQLIPRLTARAGRVSLIKHAHHGFDVDQPGKDSYEHRRAGATEVLVTSANRWAPINARAYSWRISGKALLPSRYRRTMASAWGCRGFISIKAS